MATPDRTRLADPRTMSFGEHLEELRRRMIYALIGIVPIFIISLVFGSTLLQFVLDPAESQLRAAGLPPRLIYTGPLELLGSWLKVGVVATLVLGVPFIFFQLWKFISPGLYEHEKRFVRFLLPLSVALSLVGLAFLYYVMLPAMLAFLIKFGATMGAPKIKHHDAPSALVLPTVPVIDYDPDNPAPGAMWFNSAMQELRLNVAPPATESGPAPAPQVRGVPMTKAAGIAPQYKVSEYVGLVFTTSLAFVLGFQTPVVVLLLGWIGIVEEKILRKSRKYALFFAFCLSAVLSPSPDPMSMFVLAIPLYMLYEFGLFLLKFFPPARVARGIRPSDLTHAPEREGPDAGDE